MTHTARAPIPTARAPIPTPRALIPSLARVRGCAAMFIPLVTLAGGLGAPGLALAGPEDLEVDALPELWATTEHAMGAEYFELSGDFDGDGMADIARVRGVNGVTAVDVLRSDGDAFAVSTWAAAALGGFWLTQKYLVADCNGDGLDDIVRIFDDGGAASLDVLLSSGSSFGYSRYATQIAPWNPDDFYRAGDFNGDGYGEVARIWRDQDYFGVVDVFESDGLGFTSVRWATQFAMIWSHIGLVAGDYDGDGATDIARITDDGGWNLVDLLRANPGASSFDYEAGYASEAGGHEGQQREAADFDGDGIDDLVLIDGSYDHVSVLLSDGSTMSYHGLIDYPELDAPGRKLVGDYDGDGKAELAVLDIEDATLIADVWTPEGSDFDGEPEYTPATRWATEQGGFWDAQLYFAGDFNGDGSPEIARVFDEGGATSVDVHLNTGDGLVYERWMTRIGGHWAGMDFVVGDFDGDGTTDLVKAWDHGGATSLDVYLSDGASFPGFSTWADRQGGHWAAQKFVVGDYDGDGRDDVAKVWNNGPQIWVDVYRSSGAGFDPFTTWIVDAGGVFSDLDEFLAGDFDGDGRDDIARMFEESTLYTIGLGWGLPDAELRIASLSVDVYRSTGVSFAAARWSTGQELYAQYGKRVVGDFDADGRDDIVAYGPTETGHAGMVLYRSHAGVYDAFLPRMLHRDDQIGYSPQVKVAAADFDVDGFDELATIYASEGSALTNFDVWGGQTDPDPSLMRTPGDGALYTPAEAIANLADSGFELVASAELSVGQCTVVYGNASEPYPSRDLGVLVCVDDDGGQARLEFEPVYGGCAWAYEGEAQCEVGVEATDVTVEVGGVSQTVTVTPPTAYACGSISREAVCGGIRSGMWEKSFAISSSGDIEFKAGVYVGPFAGASAGFQNGALSGQVNVPGLFEVEVEVGPEDVVSVGEAAFTYVSYLGEIDQAGAVVDFVEQGLGDVAGSVAEVASDIGGKLKDVWDSMPW